MADFAPIDATPVDLDQGCGAAIVAPVLRGVPPP
jgi:hypothetical protein